MKRIFLPFVSFSPFMDSQQSGENEKRVIDGWKLNQKIDLVSRTWGLTTGCCTVWALAGVAFTAQNMSPQHEWGREICVDWFLNAFRLLDGWNRCESIVDPECWNTLWGLAQNLPLFANNPGSWNGFLRSTGCNAHWLFRQAWSTLVFEQCHTTNRNILAANTWKAIHHSSC